MIELINVFDVGVIEFIQNNLHNPTMDKIMILITGLGRCWSYMDFNRVSLINKQEI